MNTKLVISLLIPTLVGCNTLPKDWAETDTIGQSAYMTMHVADWRTSMDIARHPGYYETNPILGKHPSNAMINSYFLTTAVIHYSIAKALPPKQRKIWHWGTFLIELKYVVSNLKMGLVIF